MSLIRSEVTSRSNWAKERRTLRGQPTHAGGGVEALGHRDERDAISVEQLDQLGEVGERAGEPVDLVDHHHIDAPGADGIEQELQGGPVEGAA